MHIAVPHFRRLANTSTRRLKRFREEIEALQPPLGVQCDRLTAHVAIEALNVWASVARTYYLSSCRAARVTSGQRVVIQTPGVKHLPQAIHFAIQHLKPTLLARGGPWRRRDEPTWHDPQTLLKLTSAIGSSNERVVQTALSYQTRVFVDLPVYRNFFAHRNDETARNAKAIARHYRISPHLHPSQILLSPVPGRPQRLLSDWLDDVSAVIELLCL